MSSFFFLHSIFPSILGNAARSLVTGTTQASKVSGLQRLITSREAEQVYVQARAMVYNEDEESSSTEV